MSIQLPVRLVLTPDALGRCVVESGAVGVLREWREGTIQPVVSRSLVVRYLRVLHRLGLAERTLRWWGWWFGSPEKVHIVLAEPPATGVAELCVALATQARAEWILHGRTDEAEAAAGESTGGPPRWVAVHKFRLPAPAASPPASPVA